MYPSFRPVSTVFLVVPIHMHVARMRVHSRLYPWTSLAQGRIGFEVRYTKIPVEAYRLPRASFPCGAPPRTPAIIGRSLPVRKRADQQVITAVRLLIERGNLVGRLLAPLRGL